MRKKIKKGDIYLADMNPAIGSEQGGIRPVLIIQNNKGNKYSPTTMVACLSTKIDNKAQLPTHYILPDGIGLKYRSIVMLEQIFTIDKSRLIKRVAVVPKLNMRYIENKIRKSFDLKTNYRGRKDGSKNQDKTRK